MLVYANSWSSSLVTFSAASMKLSHVVKFAVPFSRIALPSPEQAVTIKINTSGITTKASNAMTRSNGFTELVDFTALFVGASRAEPL